MDIVFPLEWISIEKIKKNPISWSYLLQKGYQCLYMAKQYNEYRVQDIHEKMIETEDVTWSKLGLYVLAEARF